MCFTIQKRCLHSGQVLETSAHFRMHRTQKLQAVTSFSCRKVNYLIYLALRKAIQLTVFT